MKTKVVDDRARHCLFVWELLHVSLPVHVVRDTKIHGDIAYRSGHSAPIFILSFSLHNKVHLLFIYLHVHAYLCSFVLCFHVLR